MFKNGWRVWSYVCTFFIAFNVVNFIVVLWSPHHGVLRPLLFGLATAMWVLNRWLSLRNAGARDTQLAFNEEHAARMAELKKKYPGYFK